MYVWLLAKPGNQLRLLFFQDFFLVLIFALLIFNVLVTNLTPDSLLRVHTRLSRYSCEDFIFLSKSLPELPSVFCQCASLPLYPGIPFSLLLYPVFSSWFILSFWGTTVSCSFLIDVWKVNVLNNSFSKEYCSYMLY